MFKINIIAILLLLFTNKMYAIDEVNKFNLVGKVQNIVEEDFKIDESYGTQGKSMVTFFYFDRDGKITEEKETDQVGNTVYGITYVYNSNNSLHMASIYKGEKRELVSGKTYKYTPDLVSIEEKNALEKVYLDANGNEIKREMFYDGQLNYTRTFKYSGSKVSEEYYKDEASGEEYLYSFVYNNGLLIAKNSVDASGTLLHYTKYSYNDKKMLASEVSGYVGSDDISSFTYQYTYDEIGNWKEKKEFLNKKLYSIILRKIKYYND